MKKHVVFMVNVVRYKVDLISFYHGRYFFEFLRRAETNAGRTRSARVTRDGRGVVRKTQTGIWNSCSSSLYYCQLPQVRSFVISVVKKAREHEILTRDAARVIMI